jgi:hypothetical protein
MWKWEHRAAADWCAGRHNGFTTPPGALLSPETVSRTFSEGGLEAMFGKPPAFGITAIWGIVICRLVCRPDRSLLSLNERDISASSSDQELDWGNPTFSFQQDSRQLISLSLSFQAAKRRAHWRTLATAHSKPFDLSSQQK